MQQQNTEQSSSSLAIKKQSLHIRIPQTSTKPSDTASTVPNDEIIIAVVPVENVGMIWHRIEGFVSAGAKYSGGIENSDTLLRGIMGRRYHLVVVTRGEDDILAALIFEVIEYPLRKVMFIRNMGGQRMRLWLRKSYDFCKMLGKELGLDSVETAVRPAMARVLEKYGVEQKRIIMGMEI